jgi:hemolysin activation/secretion protein
MKSPYLQAVLCIGLTAMATANAQESADRVEKRFDKAPEPKSSLQPLMIPIDEMQAPAQAEMLRFTLKDLTVSGNTAISQDELAPLYADLMNKEVSLLDIYRVRNAITARYGAAGYGLSKAVIPEQRIQAEGRVRIDVIEGFVEQVIIEGATDEQRDYLAHLSAQIKGERPLKATTLERYLLLANDRFAIKVTSTLKASDKTPAASILIIKVEPAPKIEGSLNLDNRGTDAVGPYQINASLAANGLFGRPGQATLSYATVDQSKELQYLSLTYTEVVSLEGTSVAMGWSQSDSQPGIPVLRLLDNISGSETWWLRAAYPFVRTRRENLSASIKYEQRDTDSRSLQTLTSQDKIRSLRLGLNYDRADAYSGINQAVFEYSIGIAGLGASDANSPLKSRADGKPDYQKVTLSLSRQQELEALFPALRQLSLNLALMSQYTSDGLLSSEECGIGGQQIGRAYDSSEITGDRCLAGSLELRYSANTAGTPFKHAQWYAFYDGGTVTNETPLSATDPVTKSLSSAGLGVRFGLPGNVSGSIEATQPLTRLVANEGNKHARLFASLSVRF